MTAERSGNRDQVTMCNRLVAYTPRTLYGKSLFSLDYGRGSRKLFCRLNLARKSLSGKGLRALEPRFELQSATKLANPALNLSEGPIAVRTRCLGRWMEASRTTRVLLAWNASGVKSHPGIGEITCKLPKLAIWFQGKTLSLPVWISGIVSGRGAAMRGAGNDLPDGPRDQATSVWAVPRAERSLVAPDPPSRVSVRFVNSPSARR